MLQYVNKEQEKIRRQAKSGLFRSRYREDTEHLYQAFVYSLEIFQSNPNPTKEEKDYQSFLPH